MNQKNTQICDLLPLYYEGQLNEEQIQTINNWIEASDENKQIANHIKEIYQASDTLFAINNIDTRKSLRQVHNKMNKNKKIDFLIWIQRIAAILFIPLLITYFLKYSFVQHKEPIQTIKLTTSPGMIASTQLPDGTSITLNSNSSLTYPIRFEGKNRYVKLEGEGFFKVSKDAQHPFLIKTPQQAIIRVYGTQFDLEAYRTEKNVTATLVEGSIAMRYENKSNKWQECKINPGQEITYYVDKRVIQVAKSDIDVTIAWKDGQLIFRDTPFKDVLKSLSKRFNVDFIIKNPKCYDASFTGVIKKQRLERILEYFTASSNIQFKYDVSSNLHQEKQIIEIY